MGDIITQTKDLLVAAAVGAEGGLAVAAPFDIYAGPGPADQNAVIGIVRGPGTTPNPKWRLDFPGIQVRVRGEPEDYGLAHSKAQEVKDALLGLESQTLDGDIWVSVTMPQDIIDLGQDGKGRQEFALNFNLIIEPSSGTNRTSL